MGQFVGNLTAVLLEEGYNGRIVKFFEKNYE